MKKGLMVLSFIAATLSAGQALSAPAVVLDDINLIAGQTRVDIGIYIQTDNSAPVGSIKFDYIPIAGFNLTGITFNKFTDDWGGYEDLVNHSFFAIDGGNPSVSIDSNYHLATLHYSFVDTFFNTKPSVQISFNEYLLGNPSGIVYSPVPISGGLVTAAPVPVPAAAWLLGSGLLGLIGLRRKGSASGESVNIVE